MSGRTVINLLVLTALVAGAATILVKGATAKEPGAARRVVERLLAPGPLNRHHLKADCLTCHVAFRGTGSQGCLAGNCHSRPEIEKGEEERPAVGELHRQTADLECTVCHTEHTGGRLTIAFHSAGEAASPREDCAACHGRDAELAHPDIADPRCAACHKSTSDWKRVDFDHRLVEGERCASCHRVPGGRLHQVARDVSCTVCHNTESWEDVRLRSHPRLPEFREHMQIPCLECHPDTLRRAVPCRDCHGRGGRFFEED